jgi:streptogramin lyase
MRTQKAEVLAEFTFPGVASVHGVTHDGTRAWIALGDRLQSVEPDGSFGRALSVRAEAGSAFDGRHFYQIAAGTIQKVDPATGAVVATVPAPPDTDFAGLTWAEGALWVGQYEGRRILKLDPETGRVLRTVQSDRLVTGVTFAEGELWHGAVEGEGAELRRVDPGSGEALEALEMPDAFVSGLEYDGKGRLYAGTGKSGRLRVIRRPKG